MGRLLLILCCTICLSGTAVASEWYCDPVNGNTLTGDGSQANPWGSFQSVWADNKVSTRQFQSPYDAANPVLLAKNSTAPVKPGDTIYLMSGYHGDIVIACAINSDYIYVKALPGNTPRFRRLSLTSAAYWEFDGISISLSYAPTYTVNRLVDILDSSWNGPGDHIVIKNCELFCSDDVSGWSAVDWRTKTSNGFYIYGPDFVTVSNCELRHLGYGIDLIDSSNAQIIKNKIHNICLDGIRVAGGNYVKVNENYIHDIMTTDYIVYDEAHANHYDGIQMWTRNNLPQIGMEIIGNKIIPVLDPNLPYNVHSVQGIGLFDGWYENFIVENNIVDAPNAYHGITLTGARNCKVVNNTVTNANIYLTKHKNGTYGENNIVANNLTNGKVDCFGAFGGCVYTGCNLTYISPTAYFVNYPTFDYHLLDIATGAIDNANTTYAPTIDADQMARDAAPDIGALEYNASAPVPQCSATSLIYCTTETVCLAAGLNWCSGVCQVAACPGDPPATGNILFVTGSTRIISGTANFNN